MPVCGSKPDTLCHDSTERPPPPLGPGRSPQNATAAVTDDEKRHKRGGGEIPSVLKVQRKVSGPVSVGELLTTPPTLTSTESRPAGRRAEGGNRWRAAELQQIGGQGVMSRRGESEMTGSGGVAGAG